MATARRFAASASRGSRIRRGSAARAGAAGGGHHQQFVHEAVDEALKLESALARLRTERLIALSHYSPIEATVKGEPLEIYPFLGWQPLEGPLSRFP